MELMVNGQWSLFNGQWSLFNGQWSMVTEKKDKEAESGVADPIWKMRIRAQVVERAGFGLLILVYFDF